MARTINPQLFGPVENPAAAVKNEVALHAQVHPKRLREIEIQFEGLNQKIDKLALSFEQKVQQLYGNQKVINEQVKKLSEAFTQQQVVFQTKMNERRTAENRSQELIDRHQIVVSQLELRAQQLQKVAAEQAIKIKAYQATYDEILREIRDLKRPY